MAQSLARSSCLFLLPLLLLLGHLASTTSAQSTNQTETLHIQLTATCHNATDCLDANSLCIANHCVCKLGYFVSGNGTESCVSTTCNSNPDCAVYGSVSTCDTKNSVCTCASPHQVDHVAQKCINFEEIKNNCTVDHQCGDHFRCNDGKCECRFGYSLNGAQCTPITCSTDKECPDAHTTCNQSAKTCQCAAPFELSERHQNCRLRIGQNCTGQGDSACGENALCRASDGTCDCPFGLVSADHFHCKPVTCSDNANCRTIFGTNDTMCRKETKRCECFPPNKFRLDEATQLCIELEEPPACPLGQVPVPSGGCEHFPCSFYLNECDEVFPYSTCSNERTFNSTCVCLSQFELDEAGVKCVAKQNLPLVYGVMGVAGVLVLGPLLFWGIKGLICGL